MVIGIVERLIKHEMRVILTPLLFLPISYTQTGYGYLKLKNGKALQIEIMVVYEQVVYYKLLLPLELGDINVLL